MSKAVKSVGRAIKKVVSGIGRAVKKVASSKIGKIILAATTVYFGGAALMGAVGGASGGISGAIAGAGSGLSSAASGISSAWSSLLGGEIGAAGTALADGFMGTSATTAMPSAAGAVSEALQYSSGLANAAMSGGGAAETMLGGSSWGDPMNFLGSDAGLEGVAKFGEGVTRTDYLTNIATPAKIPAPTSSGLLASIMNNPYTAPALISGGTQLVGGLLQGYGASQAQKEKLAQDEALRRQYGLNIGYDAGWKKYG